MKNLHILILSKRGVEFLTAKQIKLIHIIRYNECFPTKERHKGLLCNNQAYHHVEYTSSQTLKESYITNMLIEYFVDCHKLNFEKKANLGIFIELGGLRLSDTCE